jgi:integrase
MAGRRGNNEGSVFKRADGRWEARIRLSNGTRKSFYGKTRQSVQRKLAQAQRDVDLGLPIVGERQTLTQYIVSWLEAAKHQLKASAYRRYRTNLRCHILPALGEIPLSKLTPQQVQAFYTAKLNTGLSLSTVANIHTVLHSALREAARLGLVQRNVADLVRKPRRRRAKTMTLSEEQVQAFLRAARGDRLEALYVLAVTTGLRAGELLGLSWSDVNLEQGFLEVTLALQESAAGPGKFVLSQPKTEHSLRRIALSQTAIQALRQHRERQYEERARCGQLWDASYNLVFPNTIGRPLHPSHLRRREYHPLLQRAGLPHIRLHDLRHTAATLLLRRKVNPKVVSEMLGHANIAITLDIYAHVMPDMQEEAARVMDEVVLDTGDQG